MTHNLFPSRDDARAAIKDHGQSRSVHEAILLTIARQYADCVLVHVDEVDEAIRQYRLDRRATP